MKTEKNSDRLPSEEMAELKKKITEYQSAMKSKTAAKAEKAEKEEYLPYKNLFGKDIIPQNHQKHKKEKVILDHLLPMEIDDFYRDIVFPNNIQPEKLAGFLGKSSQFLLLKPEFVKSNWEIILKNFDTSIKKGLEKGEKKLEEVIWKISADLVMIRAHRYSQEYPINPNAVRIDKKGKKEKIDQIDKKTLSIDDILGTPESEIIRIEKSA